ncbi:MAG: hypothetical protein IPF92_29865 [Myxococcales bacterium]|nr:hypothetical protein [Myxococcales bacterium]
MNRTTSAAHVSPALVPPASRVPAVPAAPASPRGRGPSALRRASLAALAFATLALAGCPKDDKPKGDLPPPLPGAPGASGASASAAAPAACATGGGQIGDPTTAAFFPRVEAGYCVDPQGETRTYGEKGKYSMEEVCTTAFDGECVVYMRFGLKRVVSFRYVDAAGQGATVDVVVSQFADAAGALGMYTMRVVAGDPADPSTPRVLEPGKGGPSAAMGALGTGRAYVWRGAYVVELQYNNERETPAQLRASSDAVLGAIGRATAKGLPEHLRPRAVTMLPDAGLIPNGLQFFPKEPFGWKNVGPTAVGFYKEGDRRWRTVSMGPADEFQAKDMMKTLKQRPGSIPVSGVGEEAVHVVNPGEGSAPKVEILLARKGGSVVGVADEEYALKAAAPDKVQAARLTKDEAIAKVKAILEKLPPPAPR